MKFKIIILPEDEAQVLADLAENHGLESAKTIRYQPTLNAFKSNIRDIVKTLLNAIEISFRESGRTTSMIRHIKNNEHVKQNNNSFYLFSEKPYFNLSENDFQERDALLGSPTGLMRTDWVFSSRSRKYKYNILF